MCELDRFAKGQVSLVTGAGRGIGRSIALGLAESGMRVVLASRNKEQLESVAREREDLADRFLVVPTDISSPESVTELARIATERFGAIDVLVNNSGIIATTPLIEQSYEEWDSVFSTNVRGTFLVTQAIGKLMISRTKGKIINIASNFGYKGVANHVAYCASKAAIISMTKSLAVEWARHGIQVNAIAPGYFATDLTADVRTNDEAFKSIMKAVPARRMGNPNELVSWVQLLSSPASDFMTGETIVIDGGQVAR